MREKGRRGRVETCSKYCCKILEIMNKLMNFFMNHGLIFLNTAPTPQNIVLMIVEKHILIIWNVSEKSSSNSTSVHILHHHFRGGGGSRAMMMLMTQGGVGGPKLAQSWWCNMCTLPYLEIQHWNANQESLYENDYPKKVGEIQCTHGGACANLYPVY